MNANLTPIPYDLCKPSKPQSPDVAEATPASVPLQGEVNSSPLNDATSDPPNQDVSEGSGESEIQTPKVSVASSISKANTNVMLIPYVPHLPS